MAIRPGCRDLIVPGLYFVGFGLGEMFSFARQGLQVPQCRIVRIVKRSTSRHLHMTKRSKPQDNNHWLYRAGSHGLECCTAQFQNLLSTVSILSWYGYCC